MFLRAKKKTKRGLFLIHRLISPDSVNGEDISSDGKRSDGEIPYVSMCDYRCHDR